MKQKSEEKNINIILQKKDAMFLSRMFNKNNIHFQIDTSYSPPPFLGFDASSVQNIILCLGSAGIVTAVAKIIISFIRERKKEVVIRKEHASLEITTKNIRPKEIKKLLEELENNDTLIIISTDRHLLE